MDAASDTGRLDLRFRKRPRHEAVIIGKLIAALGMMRGHPMVPMECDIYEDRSVDVPIAVIALAVRNLVDAGGWRPDVHEFMVACEKARCEVRGAVTFTICEREDGKVCSRDGWIEQVVDGIHRAVRCPCWHAHQAKVQQLGAGDVPLALPAAREFAQVAEGE